MSINLFPCTSLLDNDDALPIYARALCVDAMVWGLAVAFCWLWIPMLMIYLTMKLISVLRRRLRPSRLKYEI